MNALRDALAPGDRLAILRELARLSGGRFDLPASIADLSDAEIKLLRRFRLAQTGERSVRSNDVDLEGPLQDFAPLLSLDPTARTSYARVQPDAPLIRSVAHSSYRNETQRAALGAMLMMPDASALMVSMPTGSGKSLLFQAGALTWRRDDPGSCVIVFVPTSALANDHARTLRTIPGLERSRALTGALAPGERSEILDAFRRGEVPVLLLSPEAAFGSARAALLEASKPPEAKFGLAGRLVAVYVDEAHIVESWGRTFRPEFQRLPALIAAWRTFNPRLRTILLSATLTDAARTVLRRAYATGPWLEVHARVPRYDFDILARSFENPAERDVALMAAIDVAPRPAIVYTTRVRDAQALFDKLRTQRGYSRLALCTGMTEDAERQRIIDDWSADRIDLVVATSAFGLGIDKTDVRAVLHACLPESAARWYQEIGRASRDGYQGFVATLWTRRVEARDGSDEDQARYMASTSWLSRELAEQRWKALRDAAIATWDGPHRRLRLPLDAAREDLGRLTGARNRRWNMSLLNLVQRAEALRIDATADRVGPPVWDLTLLDDGLMVDDERWAAAWDAIFELRTSEMRASIAELFAFTGILEGSTDECLLRGAFGLLEPNSWDVPRCGRCPSCRRRGTRAPVELRPEGLTEVWPSLAARSALPDGLVLVAPNDERFEFDLGTLLDRLLAVGFEQFVVSARLAESVAVHVARSGAKFGFVFTYAEWLEETRRYQPLPTAVLVDIEADVGLGLTRAREFASRHDRLSLAFVASPHRKVDGRALSQVASSLAAFSEDSLMEFVRGRH